MTTENEKKTKNASAKSMKKSGTGKKPVGKKTPQKSKKAANSKKIAAVVEEPPKKSPPEILPTGETITEYLERREREDFEKYILPKCDLDSREIYLIEQYRKQPEVIRALLEEYCKKGKNYRGDRGDEDEEQ